MKRANNIERDVLIKSARTASTRAKRISVALGLPVKVISKGVLVEELPNGQVKEIRKIEKVKSKIALKKGAILCLK